QLRMHLLPGLRGDDSRWALPELRRRVGGSSHSPGRETGAASCIHRTRGEIGRLRQSFCLNGSASEGTTPAAIQDDGARFGGKLAITAAFLGTQAGIAVKQSSATGDGWCRRSS